MRTLMAVSMALLLSGCSLWPNRAAAEANLKNWWLAGTELTQYIEDDATLDKDSKELRKGMVSEAIKLAEKILEVSK